MTKCVFIIEVMNKQIMAYWIFILQSLSIVAIFLSLYDFIHKSYDYLYLFIKVILKCRKTLQIQKTFSIYLYFIGRRLYESFVILINSRVYNSRV